MADTKPIDTKGTDSQIKDMEAVFDMAIAKSMEITKLTTAKKAELDATKQRPQN